jgi:hypothetical protein
MEAVGLQGLKRKAEAALARGEAIGEESWYGSSELFLHGQYPMNGSDSDYIAAASPKAVSSLIAEVESLRKKLEEANEAKTRYWDLAASYADELIELRAQVKEQGK